MQSIKFCADATDPVERGIRIFNLTPFVLRYNLRTMEKKTKDLLNRYFSRPSGTDPQPKQSLITWNITDEENTGSLDVMFITTQDAAILFDKLVQPGLFERDTSASTQAGGPSYPTSVTYRVRNEGFLVFRDVLNDFLNRIFKAARDNDVHRLAHYLNAWTSGKPRTPGSPEALREIFRPMRVSSLQ